MFNEGDFDAYVSHAHPDVEWTPGVLGTPTYYGREGMRKMLRDVAAAWSDMRIDVVGDPLAVGDAVVVEFRLKALGRSTGAPVEASQFFAAEFKDGLCIRGRGFMSRRDALEAIGVRA